MPFDDLLNPYVVKVRQHSLIVDNLKEHLDFFQDSTHKLVDLGCGNGHFLQTFLSKNPGWSGLGVEKRFKRSFKTAEKLEGLSALVLQNDIDIFLNESPNDFWNEVWIQFPDPWPKARHEKNRMIKPGLLTRIAQVLKSDGRFCFRSDCEDYWNDILELNREEEAFSDVQAERDNMFVDHPSTLFQQKFVGRGVPIYSLQLKK
jgi:tRNA (guanine-N7-)-methyltransferase